MASTLPTAGYSPPPPVIEPTQTYSGVTDAFIRPLFEKTRRGWLIGFGITFLLVQLMLLSITWLLFRGVGVWGINIPIGWGFAIINFRLAAPHEAACMLSTHRWASQVRARCTFSDGT